MSKILRRRLERGANAYVRHIPMAEVENHEECRTRQYNLGGL